MRKIIIAENIVKSFENGSQKVKVLDNISLLFMKVSLFRLWGLQDRESQ